MKTLIPPGGWVVLAAATAFVGFFSSSPAYTFFSDDQAQLAVSFKHTTPRLHPCADEELKTYLADRGDRPRHMQNAKAECGSRERFPLALRITVDGKRLAQKEINASGWRHDNSIFVLERHMVTAGRHEVTVEMGEKGAAGGYPFRLSGEIDFGPRAVVAIDFKNTDFKVFK